MSKRQNKKEVEGRKTIATEIVLLKAKCGELGLFRTMHAMESAVQTVGWELAEMRDPKQRKIEEEYRKSVER